MAKHQRKIAAALRERRENFNPGNPGQGLKCHKPGSQNRKKGYGAK